MRKGNQEMFILVLSMISINLTFVFSELSSAQPVPDTGQTQSYNNIFGEDSDYVLNPQSYTKLDENGNDLPDEATEWLMVRDNVTELIWEVKTDDGTIHDIDNTYSWEDAQNVFIAELDATKFGGFNDWRLPTVNELFFIINRNEYDPSINTNYFPITIAGCYCSSNPVIYSYNEEVWSVQFREGKVVNNGCSSVRAVRGTQFSNEFIANGDQTVTDLSTGLMWQQDMQTFMSWVDAIAYCEELTLAGYNDWRLPSINELQSIVDYNRYHPSIDTEYFFNNGGIIWSSTSISDSLAWCIFSDTGKTQMD